MHAYWPKSTPIAKGLVEDINAMHAYGRSSAPIAQGLVYDINALHAFWLRESKRTYGPVSTPIAQGLVEIINIKGKKIVMSPKAQGLVSNTHHGKKRMLKHCTHDSMNAGKRPLAPRARRRRIRVGNHHLATSCVTTQYGNNLVSTLKP